MKNNHLWQNKAVQKLLREQRKNMKRRKTSYSMKRDDWYANEDEHWNFLNLYPMIIRLFEKNIDSHIKFWVFVFYSRLFVTVISSLKFSTDVDDKIDHHYFRIGRRIDSKNCENTQDICLTDSNSGIRSNTEKRTCSNYYWIENSMEWIAQFVVANDVRIY